ncbi:LphB [Legionella quinlivanii]|uniref:LphB n=1 Tax=Legionella quinlivanii TaxID=45073 RepID=A0A0W0XLG0_9GAMM|nr:hypothetical protein [Legionella quinlivanii]KTD45315.1 LphB [Legionella quinlivanii]MCW8450436.1 protein LphB [Legionella quinlivanii]SEG01982.1 hypothetical protein SAMN02746093_01639 [Legionella quinlivanii DSM 21216]STY11385.1 LphB [Legionella quinlivanii]
MICNKKIYYALVAAALGYLVVLQVAAIWPFTIDDMYISLRYARHLAEGKGLLWNLREAPVEGYSNYSFVLLGALAIHWGLDPVVILKTAGVIGLLLTIAGLYLLARLVLPKTLALLPSVILLLYKGEIIWAASGLETACYQAMLVYSLYFLLKGNGYQTYPNDHRKGIIPFYFICFSVLMSIASLTRPEAPFVFILFSLLLVIDNRRPMQFFATDYSLCLLIFLLIYLPYFFWRWHFFGSLFPNSVYCKGFDGHSAFSLDWTYLKLIWPFILVSLPVLFQPRDKLSLYFWTPSLLYLILLVQSDSVAAFYNRLFLPVLPFIFILAVQGVYKIVRDYLGNTDDKLTRPVCITIGLSVLLAVFVIPIFSLSEYRYFSQMPVEGEKLRDRVLQWLDVHAAPSSTVVLSDSGRIPFKSNLRFIDSYCLNNRKMTEDKSEFMYQRFCANLFKEKPEIIILTSLKQQGKIIYTPADACLKEALTQQSLYKYKAEFKTPDAADIYRYEIYSLNH